MGLISSPPPSRSFHAVIVSIRYHLRTVVLCAVLRNIVIASMWCNRATVSNDVKLVASGLLAFSGKTVYFFNTLDVSQVKDTNN